MTTVSKFWFALLSMGVFILALLLRLAPFLYKDFFFFQDQSRDLLLAKQIVEGGKIILIGARTGFGGLFHGPLWIYSLIPSFFASHGDPYWTLIPVYLLYSMGIVVAGYLLGWKLYDKWSGLIIAFFLAISASLIASIYFMTNAHAAPLIFIFYLFFIIKYLRGSEKSLIISMFLIGIGFQYEPAFSVLLIPFTVLAIIINRKFNLKIILLGFIVLIISVANFLLFDLRHGFLMTKSFLILTRGSRGVLAGYENYQNIPFRALDRLHGLINSFTTPFYSKTTLLGILLIIIIGFALLPVLQSLLKGKKINQEAKEYLFLLSFPILSYVLYMLYPYPLWEHYVLPITISVALFIALSIKRIVKHRFGFLLTLVLVFIALQSPFSSVKEFYTKPQNHNIQSDSSYKNQLAVANYILDDSKGAPFSYLVFIPSTFTYGMDYLFSWNKLVHNQKITPCAKSDPTYLVMYQPLKGDNGAHDFWKKNIVKTKQKAIFEKTFPGPIVVEKLNIKNDKQAIDANYCQNLTFR